MHYSLEKRHSSNFGIITAFFFFLSEILGFLWYLLTGGGKIPATKNGEDATKKVTFDENMKSSKPRKTRRKSIDELVMSSMQNSGSVKIRKIQTPEKFAGIIHGGEPVSYHMILMIGSTCYFWKFCAIRVRLC